MSFLTSSILRDAKNDGFFIFNSLKINYNMEYQNKVNTALYF